MVRYSTALSYLILFFTVVFCLKSLGGTRPPSFSGPLFLLLIHSLLGVFKWGNPSYGHRINSFYGFVNHIQSVGILPWFVHLILLKYQFTMTYMLVHLLIGLVLPYGGSKLWKTKYQSLVGCEPIVIVNCLLLLGVSVKFENFYALGSGISFWISTFVLRSNISLEIPKLDLYNYSVCFWAVFVTKALLETP